MIDTSHLNERGFWDVAALSSVPLVATHSCAHSICRSTRNLTDKQLDAVRESRGVVGFNLSVNDVRPDPNLDANTSLDMVVRHIQYLVDRIGEDCVCAWRRLRWRRDPELHSGRKRTSAIVVSTARPRF